MLYQVRISRAPGFVRYIRAECHADARRTAKGTWGPKVNLSECRTNNAPSSYGAHGYDAWTGEDVKKIETLKEARLICAMRARHTRNAWYDPAKARKIARQHATITI